MALLGEASFALISAAQTSIGGIIPDVVVEESARDDLIITDHPVERGAAITDHSFLRPAQIEMRIGFSNSSAGEEGYIEAVYDEMLQLQAIREPFDLFTPRRLYHSMLIAGLGVVRDEKTNNVLAMTVVCRQIIITSTQQVGGGSAAGIGDQAFPSLTSPLSDSGTRQLIPSAVSGLPEALATGISGIPNMPVATGSLAGASGR